MAFGAGEDGHNLHEQKIRRESSQKDYIVEKILDCVRKNGIRYYKVRWEDSWEREDCMSGCERLLQDFWMEQQRAMTPHPPESPVQNGRHSRTPPTLNQTRRKGIPKKLANHAPNATPKPPDYMAHNNSGDLECYGPPNKKIIHGSSLDSSFNNASPAPSSRSQTPVESPCTPIRSPPSRHGSTSDVHSSARESPRVTPVAHSMHSQSPQESSHHQSYFDSASQANVYPKHRDFGSSASLENASMLGYKSGLASPDERSKDSPSSDTYYNPNRFLYKPPEVNHDPKCPEHDSPSMDIKPPPYHSSRDHPHDSHPANSESGYSKYHRGEPDERNHSYGEHSHNSRHGDHRPSSRPEHRPTEEPWKYTDNHYLPGKMLDKNMNEITSPSQVEEYPVIIVTESDGMPNMDEEPGVGLTVAQGLGRNSPSPPIISSSISANMGEEKDSLKMVPGIKPKIEVPRITNIKSMHPPMPLEKEDSPHGKPPMYLHKDVHYVSVPMDDTRLSSVYSDSPQHARVKYASPVPITTAIEQGKEVYMQPVPHGMDRALHKRLSEGGATPIDPARQQPVYISPYVYPVATNHEGLVLYQQPPPGMVPAHGAPNGLVVAQPPKQNQMLLKVMSEHSQLPPMPPQAVAIYTPPQPPPQIPQDTKHPRITTSEDQKAPRIKASWPATSTDTESRPQCTECFQTFKKRAALERHMMIHRGIKPFQCHFCSQRFRQKHHLQGHIMLHTGERPHSCTLCNKRFRMRHHLLEHERISHKVFR